MFDCLNLLKFFFTFLFYRFLSNFQFHYSFILVGASSCSEVILKPPMNRRERRSRFDQKVVGPPPELPPESDYGRFFAAPPSGSSKCPSPRGEKCMKS